MNERVERNLARIMVIATRIKDMCECILDDCEEVTECGDMFVIESQFDRICREANDGRNLVRNTEDEFDEEE